ncbi:hypothetical protein A7U60_g3916 [Sanghuangporus baumii]|uniref:Transposase n=1 Tax=Sanghuangporus baumii TaxID=108892 RepID=A0A9Q5HZL9_SANBA|nr:hypothetical protein A7U60_g3916 [Sanghuangporus baumii]
MPFRKISEDIKQRAMWLYSQGYIPHSCCELLGISQSSFWRFRKNLRLYGSVRHPNSFKAGRPRLLNTPESRSELYALLEENPAMYLDEIQEWLMVAHQIGLARSTLHQNLHELGISYKKLRKAAAERDEVARAEFRQYTQNNWIASQLVFVDETSKDDCTIYRHYGHSVVGHRAQVTQPFVRGQRYSIVAALTIEGYLSARVVEGSVDSIEFLNFIVDEILPRMNPWPQANSVLVMDNCSIHKAEALRIVVEGVGCKLVYLPAYSPDFNPIEESFSSLKHYLRRHYIEMQTAENPILALLEACGHITGELALGWYQHAGYRLQ